MQTQCICPQTRSPRSSTFALLNDKPLPLRVFPLCTIRIQQAVFRVLCEQVCPKLQGNLASLRIHIVKGEKLGTGPTNMEEMEDSEEQGIACALGKICNLESRLRDAIQSTHSMTRSYGRDSQAVDRERAALLVIRYGSTSTTYSVVSDTIVVLESILGIDVRSMHIRECCCQGS